MKHQLRLFFLSVGLIVSSQGFADDSGIANDIKVTRTGTSEATVYIGAALGNANYDDIDESDIGFDLFVGVNLNEVLAIELGWANFGEAEALAATAEVSALHVAIVGNVALQNNLQAFGKLGLSSWDADLRQGAISTSDTGTDVFFGFGVDYQIGARSSVRFGVDWYAVDEEDITFIAVGLKQAY